MLERKLVTKPIPPVLTLIGVQGGGKSSDARLIANKLNGIFYDGDDALPGLMKFQVRKGLPILKFEVDIYVKYYLLPALITKQQEAIAQNRPLIVSQALFFNDHRQLIKAKLTELGSNTHFLVVDTPTELQTAQIRARCDAQDRSEYAEREITSALWSNPYFQQPDPALNAFKIRHLGKGYDEEFFNNFKQLGCYADFSHYQQQESKQAGTIADRTTFFASVDKKSDSDTADTLLKSASLRA